MRKLTQNKEKMIEKMNIRLSREVQYDAMQKITDRKTEKARERFLRPAYMGQFGGREK